MKKTVLTLLLALLGMTQAVAQEYEYVPFVREGVKWVYSIQNTSDLYPSYPSLPEADYFLTLEIKGDTIINNQRYWLMHKYYGDEINVENDTVPIYLREENKIVYGIIPDGQRYIDCPIGTLLDVDEYNGQEFVLYDFNDPIEFWNNICSLSPISHIEHMGTDTIAIGQKTAKCYRIVYNGIEMNYVEGIGIDSNWDGFTLNYLMQRMMSGPWAIFNFSHVVEDGRIIYKGKHYRENVGIDEVVADQRPRHYDGNYYDLTGRCMGTEVPTTPGIYIHNGNKICVSRMQ